MIHAGRERQAAGVECAAGGKRDVTRQEILARQTDVAALCRRKQGADASVRQFFRVFLNDDGIGACRYRRAGEDAYGLPALHAAAKTASCGGLADNGELRSDFGDILVADGITIHRGIVERGVGQLGRYVLGKHPSEAFMQRKALRPSQRIGPGQNSL